MRSRGSLGALLLLALLLYSAWSPFAFVSSPPRQRRSVAFGAEGDDQYGAVHNLLLGDSSSESAKAPEEAAPPAAEEAEEKKVEKAAAPLEEEAKASVAETEAKSPVAESLADEVAVATEMEPVLTQDDEGRYRFIKMDREGALRAAFQSFDVNKDDMLDRAELKAAAMKFGQPPEQIEELLKQFDDNGDGSIDFDEFKQMISIVEEGCDVEEEECFSLRKPSTWGLLFRRRRK